MHSAYLAQQILNLILNEASKNKAWQIKRVEIILNKKDHLTPQDLKFNLENLAQGTKASKAKIKISKTGNKTYIKSIEMEKK